MCFVALTALCAPSFTSQFTVQDISLLLSILQLLKHRFPPISLLHSTHKWCVSCRGTSVPLLHYHGRKENFISCKHNSLRLTYCPPFTYQYVFVEFFLHGTNLVHKLHPPLGCVEHKFGSQSGQFIILAS